MSSVSLSRASGYNGHLTQQSSGLGLYLSKKIAEQLGHKISLHSEVGQGTTVAIRFEEEVGHEIKISPSYKKM